MLNVQEIPLSKLVPSSSNVRRTGRAAEVKALAASIKAHGLLQNLTVRRGTGDNKGRFEVVAGGRRLAALQRLAAKKHLPAGARIPCHVLDDANATEISLAENALQCPMHPADQYEAFAKLNREDNMPAADIAARFGVTEAVVKQRLKLGSVSPKLINRYREGAMTLDELTAFTITDDHKAQERVWRTLPRFERSRRAILDALTEDQVPGDDRRARFVGAEAYMAAGGTIVRDLFDAEAEGYFADAALLTTLAREKLQRHAKKIIGEGWKWVSVELDFDHEAASAMRRVVPKLAPETAAKIEEIESRIEALPEDADYDQVDAMQAEIDALRETESFVAEDIARAGAFVCLGRDGTPRIERGYLRAEDVRENAASVADAEEDSESPRPDKGISEKLANELTAARTYALRYELGQCPAVAFIAVTHALALAVFYRGSDESCLELSMREASLHHIDPSLAEGKAARHFEEKAAAWRKYLPEEPEALWDFITGLAETERFGLFAHCAARSVNAVHDGKEACRNADRLARAVKLDMADYWQPTAANYLGRVSKERVLEALREGASDDAAENLAGLKKQAMAEAAATRLAAKRWLPQLLRTR